MVLTDLQSKAVDIIRKRFQTDEEITVIAGLAGTGKSTLIKYFIEGMDLQNKTVFCTFTGKASLVLRKQGLPAMTIHKLIYNTRRNHRTGKFYFNLKPILDEDYSLIVVDEISMVPLKLLEDLMTFNIPIVALGDPGQLPPIGDNNGLLDSPHIFLNEIHRQAQDNSIIKLSMMIRENKNVPYIYDDSDVKVINRSELTVGMLDWADQVLCAKNETRRTINNEMREFYGRKTILPEDGDKIICLRNYWDTLNNEEYPLINGTIGVVRNPFHGQDYGVLGQKVIIDFEADYTESLFDKLVVDTNIFKGFAPQSKSNPRKGNLFYEFDYGYAITTWKAQGSQWGKVLIYEENFPFDPQDKIKFLYTAITRAQDKVILVKK